MREKISDWKLDKVEIEFQRYGESKGKYEGKIRFSNGEYESFSFKIRPDMAQAYIDIMASDIVRAANDLGKRLISSLGLDGGEGSDPPTPGKSLGGGE